MLSNLKTAALFSIVSLGLAAAHEHHEDNIPEGEGISPDPIVGYDTMDSYSSSNDGVWAHISDRNGARGPLPQIVRSRWHVPLQSLGVMLSVAGYFLGHKHGGRQFAPNIHAKFATSLSIMLAMQVIFGIYLKLHLEKGIHFHIRRYTLITHGVVGKALPVVSWVQMLFGAITALGFCRRDHLGQCLAHFIMGSSFIAYGIVLTLLLLVGQGWLRRTGRSQEFFDSLLISAWGCVNTFTEHRWGENWSNTDYQHTSMGIVWWCAGLLGIWLSRTRSGRPQRNLMPAIVIFLTGWAMGSHPQHLMVSTKIHATFGYTLMAAGLTRIVEISFVLRDRNSIDKRHAEESNSFQFLTPFLLYASGFLFMGATEEQMALLAEREMSHVSYILVLYSIAFLLFLFVCMLLNMYANFAWPLDDSKIPVALKKIDSENGVVGNGTASGLQLQARDRDRRIKDAEEFELEGLMSDDEGEPGPELLDSPTSVEGRKETHHL
ncbi:hypothetical protein MMC18_005227 [Xylographa bjoerkii]|nr:hypothetical protein [Xylographa bjoerkii]